MSALIVLAPLVWRARSQVGARWLLARFGRCAALMAAHVSGVPGS